MELRAHAPPGGLDDEVLFLPPRTRNSTLKHVIATKPWRQGFRLDCQKKKDLRGRVSRPRKSWAVHDRLRSGLGRLRISQSSPPFASPSRTFCLSVLTHSSSRCLRKLREAAAAAVSARSTARTRMMSISAVMARRLEKQNICTNGSV